MKQNDIQIYNEKYLNIDKGMLKRDFKFKILMKGNKIIYKKKQPKIMKNVLQVFDLRSLKI